MLSPLAIPQLGVENYAAMVTATKKYPESVLSMQHWLVISVLDSPTFMHGHVSTTILAALVLF